MSYRLVAARAGARVLRPPAWLRTVRACPAMAGLRADRARTVLEVAAVLAVTARTDSTAAPTWPVLVEASGYSRATIARVLVWLRAQQLLVTLENGSTPQFRPTPRARADRPAPVQVEGNRAAVYLLTEPLSGFLSEPLPEPLPDAVDRNAHKDVDQSAHTMSPQVRTPASFALRHETPPHHPSGAVGDQPRAGARETGEQDALSDSPRIEAGSRAALDGGPRPDQDHLTASTSTQEADGRPSREAGGRAASGYRRGPRGTRGQQRATDLALAAALRTRALDLRPCSDLAVRAVVRPFLAAGWDVEDLIWAIDHEPSGTTRTFTAGPSVGRTASSISAGTGAGPDAGGSSTPAAPVMPAEVIRERRRCGVLVDGGARPARAVASPAAWLAWRLAPWAGHPAPMATRRAQAQARGEAARAAAAARRAAAAAVAAAAVPPPVALAEARAALRARRGIGRGIEGETGWTGWTG